MWRHAGKKIAVDQDGKFVIEGELDSFYTLAEAQKAADTLAKRKIPELALPVVASTRDGIARFTILGRNRHTQAWRTAKQEHQDLMHGVYPAQPSVIARLEYLADLAKEQARVQTDLSPLGLPTGAWGHIEIDDYFKYLENLKAAYDEAVEKANAFPPLERRLSADS